MRSTCLMSTTVSSRSSALYLHQQQNHRRLLLPSTPLSQALTSDFTQPFPHSCLFKVKTNPWITLQFSQSPGLQISPIQSSSSLRTYSISDTHLTFYPSLLPGSTSPGDGASGVAGPNLRRCASVASSKSHIFT